MIFMMVLPLLFGYYLEQKEFFNAEQNEKKSGCNLNTNTQEFKISSTPKQ